MSGKNDSHANSQFAISFIWDVALGGVVVALLLQVSQLRADVQEIRKLLNIPAAPEKEEAK